MVSCAYNAQGERIYMKDQAGNVIETDFDDAGREEHRRVTTLAGSFDGAVRRITMAYTELGQVETVTQYDNATVGSGSIVDEVLYSYDGWTNVSKFEQDLNSAVGAAGSIDDYEVAYTYEKATAGRNTIRRDSVTLPSGNLLDYLYLSSSGKHDDETSRVSGIEDGALRLVDYRYNGVGQVVTTLHQQPEIHWKLDPDGDDTFADLDRFNRVTSSRWTVDLATDVDFYSVDISYDRGSNITRIEDNVHTGFDASYTMDDVDRLTRTQEGTWNGTSITSETRDQTWTLSHTGNWDDAQWDLNGDGDFVDTDEYDDTRTHNAVNELTARDVDSDSTDDYTHSFDAVGNMTDDGESYKYEWDPFGRLRKVRNQSDDLVAEYRYNGLGFQVSEHADTDDDGDVDGSDLWFHSAYDERWRKLATFRESDADPKEEFIPHQAGLSGRGGSSYINLIVCRDRDANTAWTAASDGVLEEKMFYCQNWRGDVSAIVRSTGYLYEWAKYSSYGVPFGLPGGDTDSDGDCDSTDVTQIQTWINASSYDVRGDIDLDGDVDADDKSVVQSFFEGTTAGKGALSSIGNQSGFEAGKNNGTGLWIIANRILESSIGRFASRGPKHKGRTGLQYTSSNSNPISSSAWPIAAFLCGGNWNEQKMGAQTIINNTPTGHFFESVEHPNSEVTYERDFPGSHKLYCRFRLGIQLKILPDNPLTVPPEDDFLYWHGVYPGGPQTTYPRWRSWTNNADLLAYTYDLPDGSSELRVWFNFRIRCRAHQYSYAHWITYSAKPASPSGPPLDYRLEFRCGAIGYFVKNPVLPF